MEPSDAERLTAAFLSMPFDAGLNVASARIVGLPDAPLLLVHFEDERRSGQQFGAWWDFMNYKGYVHQPDHMRWLAEHAKIHLEEIFGAGPPLDDRARDAVGVLWCAMDSLDTQLPPERLS